MDLRSQSEVEGHRHARGTRASNGESHMLNKLYPTYISSTKARPRQEERVRSYRGGIPQQTGLDFSLQSSRESQARHKAELGKAVPSLASGVIELAMARKLCNTPAGVQHPLPTWTQKRKPDLQESM